MTVALKGDIYSNVIYFKVPTIVEGHNITNCSKHTIAWMKKDTEICNYESLELVQASPDFNYYIWSLNPELTENPCSFSCYLQFVDTNFNNQIVWSWRSLEIENLVVADTTMPTQIGTILPKNYPWTQIGNTSSYQYDRTSASNFLNLEPGNIYIVSNASISSVGFLYSSQYAENIGNYSHTINQANIGTFYQVHQETFGVTSSNTYLIKDGAIIVCPHEQLGSGQYEISVMQNSLSLDRGICCVYMADGLVGANGKPLQLVPYSASQPAVIYKFSIYQ